MSTAILAPAAALLAGFGTHLVLVGARPARGTTTSRRRRLSATGTRWLAQAGLEGVAPATFVTVSAVTGLAGAAATVALFGGALPAVVIGALTAAAVPATHRRRRRQRRERAHEAWPRVIEEVRVLTGSAGRSVPQALFEAGHRAPDGLREAFAVAEREWRRSTDLDRSLLVLVDLLDDPVADAVAETLLVAHEVGGSGLDLRLTALAADRRQDLRARADASARLAGARFARWFVLAVPAGMALAGLAIGDGRAAYATPTGQVGLVMGVAVVGVCWFWAEHLMQAPAEPRVIRR